MNAIQENTIQNLTLTSEMLAVAIADAVSGIQASASPLKAGREFADTLISKFHQHMQLTGVQLTEAHRQGLAILLDLISNTAHQKYVQRLE